MMTINSLHSYSSVKIKKTCKYYILICVELHVTMYTIREHVYMYNHGRPQEFFQGGGGKPLGGPPKNL